jgi:ubiquinone/menaquinone biosynthesis C-methylase UbiE
MWLFMKEKTNFFSQKHKFLHIAPEYCFINIFKNMSNLEYITGDLISPWADVKMDVHDIPFNENTFNVVICNHVLEHVEDSDKVMQEFFRVMKPGGWGIFQVPIDNNNPKTIEDKSVIDPREREKLYWQSDHLRLFGRDYGAKLQLAGFKVTESNFINEIDPFLVERYALPKNELVYFCEKI